MFNFTSICSDSGNFVKTLKILVKLIRNCPRAHAITYTNFIRSGSSRGHPDSQARQDFRRPNVLQPTEQDPAGAGKRTTTQKQGICRY